MQFKSVFIILATASLVAAQGKNDTKAASPAAGAQMMQSVPPCVIQCSNQTAISSEVGCPKGLADPSCFCTKPAYQPGVFECIMKSTDELCKSYSTNQTQLIQGKEMFDNVCKSVGITNTSSTSPLPTSTKDSSKAPPTTENKHSSASSSIQNIATGTIIFSAILAGAATLL